MTGRGAERPPVGRFGRRRRAHDHAHIERRRAVFELLESRCVLSAQAAALLHPTYVVHGNSFSPALLTAAPTGLTPTQIRHAYGFDQISFGSVQGDGSGQTIAIIDAYDSPTIASDLHSFDAYWTAHGYNLPDPPSFKRVAQDGSTNYPSTDPAGAGIPTARGRSRRHWTWSGHTPCAPKASILLVEANSPSESDLFRPPSTTPAISPAWQRSR